MTPTKNDALQKWHTLGKNTQTLFAKDWVIFKRKFLNLLYDSDLWSSDFKVEFFPLQSDIPITLLCLIVRVGSISRVLIVLQEANNVVVKCHFCEMSFMLCVNFARWFFWQEECPFCKTVSMGAIMLCGFSHFDQAPLLDISSYVTWPSQVV